MNKARRADIAKAIAILNEIQAKFEEAKEIIEQAREEEQETYDNMPEGLQSSERGERAQGAVSNLEDAASDFDNFDIEDIISKLETASE